MKIPRFENGYIASVTYGCGDLTREYAYTDEALYSLELMKQETNANAVIIAFLAMQSDNNSTDIDFDGPHIPDEGGLARLFAKARELDMKIILKPMLNCRNGMWRATINFFDKDTPPEAKWSEWFEKYTAYQVHYAKIAEKYNVDMLCIACEMVSTQRRDADWRKCIAEIRKHYSGPITWNADKYQEDEVTFWDALDVISSSGYYPIDKWDEELPRIQKVVERYQKPFFFIEYGSTTCKGAKYKPHNGAPVKEELERTAIERGIPLDALKVPNGNYDALPDEVRQLYIDVVDQEAQAEYYRATFEACERYPFVQGFGVWAWICKIKATPENIKYDSGYGLHLKKLTEVLREYFGK